MPESVYVIGAGRTDFRRNLHKEGKTIRDVIVEATRQAIANADIDPGDIQAGIVGNFASGMYTRQLHLGAFLLEANEKLRGIPTVHTEAACASGSVAIATAALLISGGLYHVVLVTGAEQQKTMSPVEGSDVLAAAGDIGAEKPQYGQHMFPKLFGYIAERYMDRYGLTERQLATVVAKNYAHARKNPLAQMREKAMDIDRASTACETNPRFAPPLKITDCSQITDGAATVVLCSGQFYRKLPRSHRAARLLGIGHTTELLALKKKSVPELPMARKAVQQAYDMASVGPDDLHAAEVHDCFSISELIAYELIGLAEPGQATSLLESGATTLPEVRDELGLGHPARSIPVNSGGGLIGDGHPVGATGVRQVVECLSQLNDEAGDRQVPGAQTMLTFNMGGSFTTCVAMVWGKT